MKISKAQRLFIAIGRHEYLTQRAKFVIDSTRPYDWNQQKIEILRYETGELKRLRALRKNLLRAALEAARSENTALYLELVTPEEEPKPYIVADTVYEFTVFDQSRKFSVCRFDLAHPHAKQAADAECARLNAERRKEIKK